MENQREIYEALLAGETLIDDDGVRLRLNDAGILINAKTGIVYSWVSGHPSIWKIYKEPCWYDNIPDGGVLCWVWDKHIINKKVSKIIAVQTPSEAGFKFISDECNWINAAPITKTEIQVFMDNAPEE